MDIRIENHGSVVLARPLNKQASAWLIMNVQSDDYQWVGGALVVEPQSLEDLITGAIGAGLEVEFL